MGETKITVDSMNFENVSAVLLDVAGTTTAINFVKDTLFPYVTKNVESFLKTSWEEEDVKKAISQLETKDLDVTKAAELITTLTEKDDKNVGLKSIQGLLFKKGYESGDIKGHVFADVPKCLESWSKSKKLVVYSTGSIYSQELLFKNTIEGDISSYISKYFDQAVGAKTEAESYKKIASELETAPQNILFLTDDVKEAEAAKAAEYMVVLLEREGNTAIPDESKSCFAVIQSFSDIPMEKVKRKLEEESVEEPPIKMAKTEEKTSADGEAPEKEQTEEIKKTEEETKTVESMDVDDEKIVPTEVPKESEIPAEEMQVAEDKQEEKVIPEEKPKNEAVECVEPEKSGETIKAEKSNGEADKTENGTQTKTVTNECETQTTISIKAAVELPIQTVKEKLMDEKKEIEVAADTTKEVESVKETPSSDEVNVENKSEAVENGTKCDKDVGNDKEKAVEVKSTETKEECKIETAAPVVENNGKVEEKKDEITQEKEIVESEIQIEKSKPDVVEVPKENGATEEKSEAVDIVEEKENKSELANGKQSSITKDEAVDMTGDAKEDEVKMKVIEGSVESAPVSVEA